MIVPAKVQARRDELLKLKDEIAADYHSETIRADAELAGLALADAAYAEQSADPAADPNWTPFDAPKPARAPRRDILGLVLDEVKVNRGGVSIAALAERVGVPPSRALAVVDYLVRVGEVFADGDLVVPNDPTPAPAEPISQQLDQAAE